MKKITVVNPALSKAQQERIIARAAAGGYNVSFFTSNKEAYQDVADAEICYGLGTDLAHAGRGLKWFCSTSAGVDVYCRDGVFTSPDVVLSNSSGAYGVTIAEHIIMVSLMLLRRQMEYTALVAERTWEQHLPIRSILGSTVTIVGTGNIGVEAAKRFRAFSPEAVIGVNRSGKCPSSDFDRIVTWDKLNEVLPETDLLVMCVPGTADTEKMLNKERLALMKDNALVINVGRGCSVDQAALAEALTAHRLGGAALDVFEKEPIPQDDPIWTCPGLLITTHVSGNLSLPWTVEENLNLFLEDLDNYLQGRPLKRAIDRSIGY